MFLNLSKPATAKNPLEIVKQQHPSEKKPQTNTSASSAFFTVYPIVKQTVKKNTVGMSANDNTKQHAATINPKSIEVEHSKSKSYL